MTITTATRNQTVGSFVASATNLNFVEWDLTQAGDAPVPGGRCATVAMASINASWNNTPDAGPDAGLIDAGVIDAGVDAGP